MASMDKIKPDSGALPSWMESYRGPYVLSCKLDGVSGMYVCDANGKHSLYTRGNGLIGQDVSHLIKVLKLPIMDRGFAIRGELLFRNISSKPIILPLLRMREISYPESSIVNLPTKKQNIWIF